MITTEPDDKSTPPIFAPLQVIDRLEVGPVMLTPRRLSAPYRVIRGGDSEQTEMVFRYEEDVFQPGEAGSLQLANMMAAQVAINYGLFCREIVFRGAFDIHDRRFIADMTENTAREIYVKKFLQPNVFITGDAARLPAVKRGRARFSR